MTRDEIYRTAVDRALSAEIAPHREDARAVLHNIFFIGKLPKAWGFDVEIEHLGSRATVSQSQRFGLAGHTSVVGAGIRLIADLGDDVLHTIIAGGASDRRFSPYYTDGLDAWLCGRYVPLSSKPPGP